MFANSVIGQSNQVWKLVVAVIALLVGSFAPLFIEDIISWTTGTILAIGGYAFGLFTIRCSNCKKMWFWEAALDARLYKRLFKEPDCPCCDS